MYRLRKTCIQVWLFIGLVACFVAHPVHACTVTAPNINAAADDVTTSAPILEDAEIQSFLDRLKNQPPFETEEQLSEYRESLRSLSGKNFERLIPQLVYFKVRVRREKLGETATHAPGFLVRQLEISDGQIAAALIPFIAVADEEIRKEVRRWLKGVETVSTDDPFEPPNFSYYRAILEAQFRAKKELPLDLIEYLYARHPSQAVLTLLRASGMNDTDERRTILWAEHQVSDVLWQWQWGFLPKGQVHDTAKTALSSLAKHPEWWARLYVAEVMRQHPPFRNDNLMAALMADEDEIVRSTVMEFATSIEKK